MRTDLYEKRKLGIFPRGKSIVFLKSVRFLQLSFLCKIDQEKVSGDVLLRKKVLYDPF